jgi:hypothetical protein
VIYGKEWARMAEKWEENNNEIFYNQIEKQGPILNFNLLRSDGSFVGASEV